MGAINKRNEYKVVLRGPSATVFRQSEYLEILIRLAGERISAIYTTRWIKRSNNVEVPGDLLIEITGKEESLEKALVAFTNAAAAFLPIIAFCTNAAIEDPEVELVFDETPGLTERDYFQVYIPEETDLIYYTRNANVSAIHAVLAALDTHPEAKRIRRGISQYHLALWYWHIGKEALALAHLWMAVEAVTKTAIQAECNRLGLSNQKELALRMKVELKDLDSEIRKRLILQEDNECYRQAKEASDGFPLCQGSCRAS